MVYFHGSLADSKQVQAREELTPYEPILTLKEKPELRFPVQALRVTIRKTLTMGEYLDKWLKSL